MSIIEEILENLSEYFDKHPSFSDYKGLDYYFDLSHMNANCELPAFCYDVGYNDDNSEKQSINPYCRSYYRQVGMRFMTYTKDIDILTGEMWDFEETILRITNEPYSWQNIHPNLVNVKYSGTEPVKSVYHQAFRDDYEDEWVCNAITVTYEIEYTI